MIPKFAIYVSTVEYFKLPVSKLFTKAKGRGTNLSEGIYLFGVGRTEPVLYQEYDGSSEFLLGGRGEGEGRRGGCDAVYSVESDLITKTWESIE